MELLAATRKEVAQMLTCSAVVVVEVREPMELMDPQDLPVVLAQQIRIQLDRMCFMVAAVVVESAQAQEELAAPEDLVSVELVVLLSMVALQL